MAVPILDDFAGEGTETFNLTLSNAVNATIARSQAVANLLALCLIAGIGFAAVRILARRLGRTEEAGAMILLRLDKVRGDK